MHGLNCRPYESRNLLVDKTKARNAAENSLENKMNISINFAIKKKVCYKIMKVYIQKFWS
jgi:hypothetical protein